MLKSGAVRVLGTMSGTSLDGVDAAVIETDGVTIKAFGDSGYRRYSAEERAVLRAALGRWPDEPGVAEAAALVEEAHAELMAGFSDVALAGFHGQTLAHDPQGRGTHQAGNGAVLAEALGLPVVWDFRSADVALGGQGAPLAPAYHFALAKWIGAEAPVAFLNLGGVGNLTWVDPRKPGPEAEGALLAFDTGPANAPLDDLMQARRGVGFDEGGVLAATGEVSEPVIERFAEHRYFFKMPPKSLDRNDFSNLDAAVAELPDADAAATLTAAVAVAVMRGAEHFPAPVERLLVTGGGRKNPVMMAMIAEGMSCPVDAVEEVGLDGDMLEAQAFAYLAVRVARGLPTSFPSTTGVGAAVGGGEISYPGETG
ncbi:anhydro-N-acetylmuramic acid kinase [Tropicimonas sediminicola]|uniref:Anhydro-N-acetylmuramic acid kinase n=1 Tax=Tropicimonas sediminicola TaxID=1031541 RepID=A0A239HC78_9RHOB|nr:anhydro-N-acetylmuramic acid kinase [Tropicimonas sediminicola]SNS78892.1 anhydro-N-acetylmuramic acid kinase [Tropicimonas sediminicola]